MGIPAPALTSQHPMYVGRGRATLRGVAPSQPAPGGLQRDAATWALIRAAQPAPVAPVEESLEERVRAWLAAAPLEEGVLELMETRGPVVQATPGKYLVYSYQTGKVQHLRVLPQE